MKVYVVYAWYDHEGGTNVAAFNSKKLAESFVKMCRDYDRLQPEYPEMGTAEAAFDRNYAKWLRRHPLGKDHSSYDGMTVYALEVDKFVPKLVGAN